MPTTHKKQILTLTKRYYTYPEFNITKQQFIKNHFYNPCLNSKVAITSTGDIIPCIFARDFIAGNVKNGSIRKLKNEIEQIWGVTKNNIEECKECEFRYACSDCRPLSIGIFGNKYGDEV